MSGESYSEKVSVNINSSTLSQIDLLVDNGYYSNRSDFINQALRNTLLQQQSTLDRLISANSSREPWFLGIYGVTARDLEEDRAQGKRYTIRGYGILSIAADCPTELVAAVIEGIQVRGKVLCSPAVRTHFGLK